MKVIFTRGVVRDRSSTFSSFKRAILPTFARLIKIFNAEILELEKKNLTLKFSLSLSSVYARPPRGKSSGNGFPLLSPASLFRANAVSGMAAGPFSAQFPPAFTKRAAPPGKSMSRLTMAGVARSRGLFLPSFLLPSSPLLFIPCTRHTSIVPNSSSARSVSLSPGTIAGRGGVEALTAAWISRLTNKRERGGERTRLMDRSRSIRLITSIDETRWTRSRSRVCSSSRY